MKLTKPKYPKIETPLAVCLDSHITSDDVVFREGDLVDTNDPNVSAEPIFWAPAGLPTAKYHELRMERFMKHLVDN
jgi:hypothetical protein